MDPPALDRRHHPLPASVSARVLVADRAEPLLSLGRSAQVTAIDLGAGLATFDRGFRRFPGLALMVWSGA